MCNSCCLHLRVRQIMLVRNERRGFASRLLESLWYGREIGYVLARLVLIDQFSSEGVQLRPLGSGGAHLYLSCSAPALPWNDILDQHESFMRCFGVVEFSRVDPRSSILELKYGLKVPRQSITIVEDEVVIAIASMMIYDDDIYGVFLHPGWLAVSSRPKCCSVGTAHCRTPNERTH